MNIHRYAESSTQSSLHDQVQCSEPHVLRRKILMKTGIYIVGWLEEVCAQGTLSMQPLTFNHSSKATEHLVYVCMWVIAGWCFRVSNTKTVRNNWENRLLLLFRICLRDLMRLISSTIFLQRFQSKSKPYMYLRYIQLNPSKLQSWQKTNTTYTQQNNNNIRNCFLPIAHKSSTPPTSWNHIFFSR